MGYSESMLKRDAVKSIEVLKNEGANEFIISYFRIKKIDDLKSHPNYKDLIPLKGESLVKFTLRYAANLVSPPQFEGESYDVECTTLKDGIISLSEEIESIYYDFNKVPQNDC